jgi:hypothetical protein
VGIVATGTGRRRLRRRIQPVTQCVRRILIRDSATSSHNPWHHAGHRVRRCRSVPWSRCCVLESVPARLSPLSDQNTDRTDPGQRQGSAGLQPGRLTPCAFPTANRFESP